MIHFYRTEGCFNFLNPGEKKAQLVITGLPADAPARSISETTEIDGEFDVHTDDVWEMLDAIEGQMEYYLISTKREEQRKVVAWLRENRLRLDVDLTRGRALKLQAAAAEMCQAARLAVSAHQMAVAEMAGA